MELLADSLQPIGYVVQSRASCPLQTTLSVERIHGQDTERQSATMALAEEAMVAPGRGRPTGQPAAWLPGGNLQLTKTNDLGRKKQHRQGRTADGEV